jgi:hypothetical protein
MDIGSQPCEPPIFPEFVGPLRLKQWKVAVILPIEFCSN